MTVLQVHQVSKRYGSSPELAVNNVSLSVERGEILAVVGESGSGKTTLLRLVAGLEVPTSGEVVLNGHVASSASGALPPERRGVGIVFQDYALFPHLRVIDNVGFGLQSVRRGVRHKRALEVLSLVGMTDYARRYPHELSGGQQQRVALARALAPRPSLLLLDEPFSNLDVIIREQVREEIGQILRAAKTTALFVVHDLDDVLSVADRIAILKNGVLQQIDTPRAIYERPVDDYVAKLFGSTNLLPAIPRNGGFDTPVGYISTPAAKGLEGAVTISIHPQDLQVERGETPGSIPATVRQTRFRGDYQEVVLTLATEDGATHQVLLHSAANTPFEVGSVLRVRPCPGRVRVLG